MDITYLETREGFSVAVDSTGWQILRNRQLTWANRQVYADGTPAVELLLSCSHHEVNYLNYNPLDLRLANLTAAGGGIEHPNLYQEPSGEVIFRVQLGDCARALTVDDLKAMRAMLTHCIDNFGE
jgi:hypothetical protein